MFCHDTTALWNCLLRTRLALSSAATPIQVISPNTKIPSSQKWADRNTEVKGKLTPELLILQISQGEPEQASSESLSDLHVVEIGLKPVKCATLETSPSMPELPCRVTPRPGRSWKSLWRYWSGLEEQDYLRLWIFYLNTFIPCQFTVNNWVEREAKNRKAGLLSLLFKGAVSAATRSWYFTETFRYNKTKQKNK